jgi:hypothetical protein
MEPSDPAIAEFLLGPDPSGLYRNLDLIHEYNNRWDADRLAKICNMYGAKEVAPPPPQPKPVPKPDAMVAPSRTNSNPTPASTDAKIWSPAEIKEFERLDRMGHYAPEVSEAMWADLMLAGSQGRIR